MNSLYGGLIVLAVIGLYILTYILNKNTAAPEGAIVITKCSTCTSGSCSMVTKEKYVASDTEDCEVYEKKEELFN